MNPAFPGSKNMSEKGWDSMSEKGRAG